MQFTPTSAYVQIEENLAAKTGAGVFLTLRNIGTSGASFFLLTLGTFLFLFSELLSFKGVASIETFFSFSIVNVGVGR